MVKTVLLVPTYNCARILPMFFSYIYKLSPQPDKTVFAENNSRDKTLQKITGFKRNKEVVRVWMRKDAYMITRNRYEVIAHVRQLLLTRARQLDPDFAIFLDSDVLALDSLMIEKLIRHELDIVGGPYLRRFPWGVYLATIWKDPDGRKRARDTPQASLEEVDVTSAGCLCLSRRVIQDRKVKFFPMYSDKASEDFGFCRWAKQQGYKIWLDGTINLRHQNMKRVKPWTTQNGKYVPFYFESND